MILLAIISVWCVYALLNWKGLVRFRWNVRIGKFNLSFGSLVSFYKNVNKILIIGCLLVGLFIFVTINNGQKADTQEGIDADDISTEEVFLSVPILDKYTPLNIERLWLLMKEYDDIWIVTDTKYTDEENIRKEFEDMLQTVEEIGATEVLGRMIIQIYCDDMLAIVKSIHDFPTYIYFV